MTHLQSYGDCHPNAKHAKVLSSITISVGQTLVLRFFGGGREVISLAPPAAGPNDATSSLVNSGSATDIIQEALDRLGACEDLLREARQKQIRPDLASAGHKSTTPGASLSIAIPNDARSASRGTAWSFPEGVDSLLIPGTLHRVVALREGSGAIHGLTYRIGRQLRSDVQAPPSMPPGSSPALPSFTLSSFAPLLADAVHSLFSVPGAAAVGFGGVPGRRGLLVVGPLGSGKTGLLRDLSRIAALHFNKAVLVRHLY